VLGLIGRVLDLREDAEVVTEVVAHLPIELAIRGLEDLVGLGDAVLIGEREGRAHE